MAKRLSWQSPWQRYKGSWHQKHIPASRRKDFLSMRLHTSFASLKDAVGDQHYEHSVRKNQERPEMMKLELTNGRSHVFRAARPMTSWERNNPRTTS